jgi:predicted aconitase
VVITCGRGEYRKAHEAGYIGTLERFGVQFVNDTCWCMLTEPVIPPTARVIMTNSGKYAHYAPGLVGRSMRFGSLEDCIKAASGMQLEPSPPRWLLS